MKKVFFASILCFLTSCSSNKVIDSFLKKETMNEKKSIFIVSNKIARSKTIKAIKGYNQTYTNKPMFNGSKLISDVEKSRLYEIYKNDTLSETWLKNEFKKNNFKFISSEYKTLKEFMHNNTINKSSILYMFSNPIFTKDKKIVFFSFYKNTTNEKENKNCIIVMKKENRYWKIVEEIDFFYFD